jgi:Ca2+/H+ antiporter
MHWLIAVTSLFSFMLLSSDFSFISLLIGAILVFLLVVIALRLYFTGLRRRQRKFVLAFFHPYWSVLFCLFIVNFITTQMIAMTAAVAKEFCGR